MGKRINFICNYASMYAGNFIPSILNLCEKLSFESIVFSFPIEAEDRNWIKYIKSKGYTVFFYRNKFFKKDIRAINKNNGIDVVYTHFISGLKIKMVAPFNHHIKLFIHIHSDFSGNNKLSIKQRIKRVIENKLIRRDATYIFVSESLYFKDKSKNKFFVRNALCLDRIISNKLDSETFLNRYGIERQHTVFLLFGWSPYIKGVDIAVKSFLNLPDNLQNKAKFIIVHGKDDGRKKCIEYLTNRLGNDSFLSNSSILFVPPMEDIFSLYSLSDVYVLASRSEGFTYSILESLFLNLQCIVNDIEGCAWAKQYENCLFFKTNDVDDLSQQLKRCIGTKREHKKNYDIAKRFDINEWSNEIKGILEK